MGSAFFPVGLREVHCEDFQWYSLGKIRRTSRTNLMAKASEQGDRRQKRIFCGVQMCGLATWSQKAYVAGGCGWKGAGCEELEGRSVR